VSRICTRSSSISPRDLRGGCYILSLGPATTNAQGGFRLTEGSIPPIAYALLAGRIIGLGLERPLIKRLGKDHDPVAVTTIFVALGCLLFAALALWQYTVAPRDFANTAQWLPKALIPGALYAVSFHVYVWALKRGEVSIITPLFSTGFILMYALDLIGGYAQLALLPILGVLLVTLGVAFLTPDGVEHKSPLDFLLTHNPLRIMRQPGAAGMLLCAAIIAVNRSFERDLAAAGAQPYLYALVSNAPPVIAGLVILALRRKVDELTHFWRAHWGIASISALLGHGAFILLLLNLRYFPPSVIEPVSQLGVFIAIALGGLWFGEKVRARWVPSAMVVLGAVLLLAR
jgi:bacterial/archaeal transporter family protein